MNHEDYITFRIGNTKYKVYMVQYTKLDSSSLPYVIEDQVKLIMQDPKNPSKSRIRVTMTNIDTIRFICDEPFEIVDMSYNMKLLTGFYCTKASAFPIKSTEFEDKDNVFDVDTPDKDLTDITFTNMNMRVGDVLPIKPEIIPADAAGFSTTYETADIDVATIDENGYITGVSAGETKITAKVYNAKSSTYVAPDFTREFTVTVAEPADLDIESVEIPAEIVLTETEDITIYAKITPFNAKYSELWTSENPAVATVTNGYIRAISAGSTIIRYQLKAGNAVFDRKIDITIKSQYNIVTRYNIISDSVGYMLSTPILYLLTNIGNSVFFNEIHDQNKIQCGTVCMCMNNSYTSSMPIVAMQGDIVTKCAINATSDIFFILVDANMRPVKLLNPFYITVSIRPDEEEPTITPGLLK